MKTCPNCNKTIDPDIDCTFVEAGMDADRYLVHIDCWDREQEALAKRISIK